MVAIRPAELQDSAELFELIQAFPTPTSVPLLQAFFPSCLTAKLLDPHSFLAVAAKAESLLGYFSGYYHPAFYSGGNTAWIDEVLVSPEYRRQGIGRQLMSAFEDWAVRQDCVLVSLATAGSRDFYEPLGYTSKAGYYKKYFTHP